MANDLKLLETLKTDLEVEVTYHLQEISEIKAKYEKEKEIFSSKIQNYEYIIQRKLFFNDEKNGIYNSFNICKKNNNNVKNFLDRLFYNFRK